MRSNKTLDSLVIRVSKLSNRAFLGRVKENKNMPNSVVMVGARRDVTHQVLDAAIEIISNNDDFSRPTIIRIGDVEYKLELTERP
ncbi:DUF7446 family protein [Xenorhabdus lircayensis]|uniref:Uncharacterized protein n=1 Tax=Xenorhabdus lircayensis TaxID=2763499 RepID=A0ABS0U3L7_9GAMM|nr:hypothetical protein [Xenorhabdus lircayensis]MBI6547386.1 hypothetical protein [Xenorhabdus lircayensis]